MQLPCQHILGKDCISKWLAPYQSSPKKNNCPLFRTTFFERDDDDDDDDDDSDDDDDGVDTAQSLHEITDMEFIRTMLNDGVYHHFPHQSIRQAIEYLLNFSATSQRARQLETVASQPPWYNLPPHLRHRDGLFLETVWKNKLEQRIESLRSEQPYRQMAQQISAFENPVDRAPAQSPNGPSAVQILASFRDLDVYPYAEFEEVDSLAQQMGQAYLRYQGTIAGMRITWLWDARGPPTEALVDGVASDMIEMALEWMVVIEDMDRGERDDVEGGVLG